MTLTTRLGAAAIALALLASTAGCGDAGFGSGGEKGGSKEAPSDDSPSGDSQESAKPGGGDSLDLDPPKNATPEQLAIAKCLANWGSVHPFDKTAYTSYREIFASVSVFGKGGYAVDDSEVTPGPKLILVHAAVSVLGEANYRFMNPNGWYCMMVGVNVSSKTQIDLNCSAKLTDNRVEVDIGSTASPSSAVGVNVFSDVKVVRKNASGGGC